MSALTDLNVAMFQAARGGHLAVVKFMIEKGANEFKLAMMEACVNGHIEIVKLMIENIEKKTETSEQYGRVDLKNGWSVVMDVDQDGHLNIFITNEDGSGIYEYECETESSDGKDGKLGLRYTTDNIEKKYHHEDI
jgi:ankyrin repeat protein